MLVKSNYKRVYGHTNDPKDTRDFLNERLLNITLRLSDKCNFSCTYCSYYDNTKGSIPFGEFQKIIKEIICVIKESKRYDAINWYIHGGEPTVYPKFVEAMLFISEEQNKNNLRYDIEVQTNSSYKKLEKFQPLIGKNIKFVCSYQHHQNTPDQFKKFCTYVMENNLFAGTDLILEDKGQDEIIAIYDWLEEQKIKYNLTFNIQTNTVDGVSFSKISEKYQRFSNKKVSEQIKVEYQDGSEKIYDYDDFSSNGMNSFKLMKCKVGLQSIIIDITFKDTIKFYKCFSDILYDKSHPFLQDTLIDFNGNKLLKYLKPTVCIHPKCICEIFIPKYTRKIKD